jgi:hypothetical protein
MSEYETDMMKLIKQIAEDIRWLRQRAEEREQCESSGASTSLPTPPPPLLTVHVRL